MLEQIERSNKRMNKRKAKIWRGTMQTRKVYNIIFALNLLLFGFVVEVSADEIDANAIINNNGVNITMVQYNNLINIGFTESEIYNMTLDEFNNNKDLVGSIVSSNYNYYRVTTNYNEDNEILSTISEEIDENTYNNFDNIFNPINPLTNGYTETNYKKMTTQIISLSGGYRYKVSIEWKKIPSTRSYDIIGIGINSNVYISSDVIFQQNYCYSSGSCSSSNVSLIKNSSTGGAAVFKLPTSSSITSMDSYLYFMVGKSSSNTLTQMYAYGDYAHAVKSTSSSNTNYFTINNSGLNLYSNIIDSYDEIPLAKTTWTGTW